MRTSTRWEWHGVVRAHLSGAGGMARRPENGTGVPLRACQV